MRTTTGTSALVAKAITVISGSPPILEESIAVYVSKKVILERILPNRKRIVSAHVTIINAGFNSSLKWLIVSLVTLLPTKKPKITWKK